MLRRILPGFVLLVLWAFSPFTLSFAQEPVATAGDIDQSDTAEQPGQLDPPYLQINGISGNIEVQVSSMIEFDFPVGAEVSAFGSNDCTGEGRWFTHDYFLGPPNPVVAWFQARWIDEPTLRSACIMVEWENHPPSLTLNEAQNSILLPINSDITLVHSEGSQVGRFSSADCSGVPQGNHWEIFPDGYVFNSPTQQTIYWQARWIDDPINTSPCLAMSWFREPGPPALLLNGGIEPVSVPAGINIGIFHPPGSMLSEFNSEDCSGNPARVFYGIEYIGSGIPVSRSYQASWTDDSTSRSDCVRATWVQQPTLGQSSGDDSPTPSSKPNVPAGSHHPDNPTGLSPVTGLPATGAGIRNHSWPPAAALLMIIASGAGIRLRFKSMV